MATRVVEGKKPYTGGKAITVDENKVISLNLRDENNLIIYDEGDDEIYVDLQLPDEIQPTDAFPVGITTGRAIVDNGWDLAGTIICAKTTSGDNIKLLYADEGTLWIDNGTGTFKQIYFKSDVDALLLALRNYIDGELAKKQNGVSSDTAPSNPSEGDLWYDTANRAMKVWDGTAWQSVGGGDVLVSDQANNIFTTGMKIWGGTQSDFDDLVEDSNTAYLILASQPTPPSPGWQPGANTIGYYTMNNDILNHATTGSTFPDGNINTAAYSTTRVHGNNTYSLYCDGSTYAYIPASSVFEFGTSDFTISCWVYSETNSGSYTGIISCYDSSIDTNYGRRISDRFGGNNNLNFCRKPSSYVDNVSGISIYNDGWHNIVLTRNSGVFKVYLDTNLVITDSDYTGVQIGRNADINLGLNSSDNTYSKFYLNDVIFENRGWSEQDVSDYYTATA